MGKKISLKTSRPTFASNEFFDSVRMVFDSLFSAILDFSDRLLGHPVWMTIPPFVCQGSPGVESDPYRGRMSGGIEGNRFFSFLKNCLSSLSSSPSSLDCLALTFH